MAIEHIIQVLHFFEIYILEKNVLPTKIYYVHKVKWHFLNTYVKTYNMYYGCIVVISIFTKYIFNEHDIHFMLWFVPDVRAIIQTYM